MGNKYNNSATNNGSFADSNDSTSFGITFLYILPTLSFLIFVGNLMVILAIKSFKTLRVPDVLIGSLAIVDLLNNFVPVLISIIVFNLNHEGFRGLHMDLLCHFFNWSATWLRLAASFIATLMSLDRFSVTNYPFFSRTVTVGFALKLVCGAVLSAAFVAAWPSMGWGRVNAFRGICSFDFAGGFAYVIVIMGYLQLGLVLVCFVSVAWSINQHLKRVNAMRAGRALTLQDGKLSVEDTAYKVGNDSNSVRKDPDKKGNRLSRSTGSKSDNNSNAESRYYKESRRFVNVLAVVVFLFYLSWMPIILSITIMLLTNTPNEVLQSLSAQMSIVGSILTPWVYGTMCRSYRQGYLNVIRRATCGLCGRNHEQNPAV